MPLLIEFQKEKKGLLVFTGVFLVTAVSNGFLISFGITVAKFKADYDISLALLVAIGYLPISLSLVFSIIPAIIEKKYKGNSIMWMFIFGTIVNFFSCLSSSFVSKPLWLFLTHSIGYGLGSTFTDLPTVILIGIYFPYHHSLHAILLSIYGFSTTLGSLAYTYFAQWLITELSWSNSMRISALVHIFICLPVSYLFKLSENEDEMKLNNDFNNLNFSTIKPNNESEKFSNSKESFFLQTMEHNIVEKLNSEPTYWEELCEGVLRKPESMLWFLSCFLLAVGFYMPFLTLPFYITIKSDNKVNPASIIGYLSLGQLLANLSAVCLAGYFKGKGIYFSTVSKFLLAVINIVWTYIDTNLNTVYLITIVYGLFVNMNICYWIISSEEVCEMSLDIILPICLISLGLGLIATPILTGAIYDVRESFRDLFLSTGFIMLLDTFVVVIIICIKQYRMVKSNK